MYVLMSIFDKLDKELEHRALIFQGSFYMLTQNESEAYFLKEIKEIKGIKEIKDMAE